MVATKCYRLRPPARMRPPPLPPAAVALVLISTWVVSVRPDTLGHGEETILEAAEDLLGAGDRQGQRGREERGVELGGAPHKVKRHGDSQVRFFAT